MSTLAELAYQLTVDPSLVGSQAWNDQATAVSSELQSNAQLIRAMEPAPPSVQHIDAELEALAALLDGGFEAFVQGLESGDVQLVAIGDQQFQFVVGGGARGRVGQAIAEYCG